MITKEKWKYFLDKFEAAKEALELSELSPEQRKEFEFVDSILSLTTNSSNKRCDMTVRSGLDPTNFSYLLKQVFWLKYRERFVVTRDLVSQLYTWYPDYQLAKMDPEFWRMSQERWQIHARIATLIVSVKKSVEIDFSALSANSDAYTVVVYRDGKELVASAGSQADTDNFKIPLQEGMYSLVLRYYSDDLELYCPRVVVDGETEVQMFYDRNKAAFKDYLHFWMNQKTNPVYLMQNLHTFYWLRFERERMPEEVRQDFLPVSNPDTIWEYGYLEAGQSVCLESDRQTLSKFRVYLTFVNEMSLPVSGAQIGDENYKSAQMPVDGAYHIRFVMRGKMPATGMPALHYRVNIE